MQAERVIDRRDNGGPELDDEIEVFWGEKYLPLVDAHWRHKAYYGGRGTAKSHTFAEALVLKSRKQHLRNVCARQFQQSIDESVKELLDQKIAKFGLGDEFVSTRREIWHKKTDSQFIFIGLDRNPDSVKSLEGADICWVEEARTIHRRAFEMIIPTIRKPGAECWWSWNPENEDDPVDEYFRGAEPPPDALVQQVYTEDNPYFYQTEMPNEMWYMKKRNYKRYLHIWGGQYDKSYEDTIFTDISIASMPVTPYDVPHFGLDFGFSNDPLAFIKAYIFPEKHTIYIAQEFFGKPSLDDTAACLDTVSEAREFPIYADSSRPETIDFLNARGFSVHPSVKGPGSVKAGITWLQGYRIVIDPRCTNMQREALKYKWKLDKRTKLVLPIPVDAENHGWDAVRYAFESVRDTPADGGVIKIRANN
jgi:phage terminase large subunit